MENLSVKCQKDKNYDIIINSLKQQIGINNAQPYFPILGEYMHFYNNENIHKSYSLNNQYKICKIISKNIDFSCDKPSDNYKSLKAKIYNCNEKKTFITNIFTKISPILDPLVYIMNKYTPDKHNNSLPYYNQYYDKKFKKINSKNNSTYIDCYFTFLGSKLFEQNICPTFPLYYGSYCGIIDKYQFDISEEYHLYENKKWFRLGQGKNQLFKLIKNGDSDLDNDFSSYNLDDNSNGEDIKMYNLSDNYISTFDKKNKLEMDVENYLDPKNILDISDQLDNMNLECIDEITSIYESEKDFKEEIVFAEIPKFPVQTILMEKLEGTLEDIINSTKNRIKDSILNCNMNDNNILLNSFNKLKLYSLRKTKEKEWIAYLFQIIFGLAIAQKIFNFTHNDLHSSNIMYTKTNKKFIYYIVDDRHYKIPTNGYILKIIDFGRSIYSVNNVEYFSDVFEYNGDAGGQYTYPDEINKNHKVIKPNMSFDLSRLSVSIIEDLYPLLDTKRENNKFYKLLKSWLIDKYGKDVRRFDDFDLYKIIARRVNSAIPKDQLKKKIFDIFLIEENQIPDKELIYKYIN